jgi:hypothetical protein
LLEPASISERFVALKFRIGVDGELAVFGRIDLTASTRLRSSASGMPPTFIFTIV